ncbi:hypothetical protein E4T44_10700 [Aureobasidium sp. EXF-8845]|nr:hypothetical protein E4T44_10700 [Aureobasidium sp. EXF-8845]KAI4843474.1 hypothetical protein E4T45_08597 [Aureobasidium sp. EXF-8846]
MQLFLVNFILILYALSSFVRADAVTDAIHLQSLASDTADTIFASLNGTAYLSSPGAANVTLNDAYFNYANSMLYLADTVQRRGRLFHSELNLPVYQSLQNLSSAVSTYGHDLASKSLVQRNSTIRTLTTGSAIVRAQSAWANNQNYPGKRETLSWSG